ncbi:MAG: DGQHR domain-containing protein [Thermoanaerobaculia bacterium]|nr:DGQHR domain-containing protein [Thermoanaerobaculia bacterium]
MIFNVFSRQELLGFSRNQSRSSDQKSVKISELESAQEQGWEIKRKNRRSISVTRPKSRSDLLVSRAWTVFYRMGFSHMSGNGGAQLQGRRDSPVTQLDVVAIDDDIALAIKCLPSDADKRYSTYPEAIAQLADARKDFARAIANTFPSDNKKYVANVIFAWNISISEDDRRRAAEGRVYIFEERELEYFEELVRHIGPAARFQFLSEVCRGKPVPCLSIRVPALHTRMGDNDCYCFSIKPEYLLKIAYVAHRARGKAIDLDAYQRLIKKSRLKKIAEFISEDGLFPTNIVINIENKRYIRFDRGKQEGDDTGGRFGWLTVSPSYGTAWIIDGQHRLFAYAGHNRAGTSYLNVLAFCGLSASKQTQLFVEINSEQKRVPRSLLVELDSNLKWDAEDEDTRLHAVISRASLALDQEAFSPLRDRILLADTKRTNKRCVSLTAIASALSRPGFFIVTKKKGNEYGPFWRDSPKQCLQRTINILSFWLREIAESVPGWWDLGSAEGGGLAMNDGITVCINVLRSVFGHLGNTRNLSELNEKEVTALLKPFATALGNYFARMSNDDRQEFRRLRGVEGQTTGRRSCEEAVRAEVPDFDPPGLDEWIRRRQENTNDEVRKIIERIEKTLQDSILGLLKDAFEGEDAWWFEGVPKNVRKKVDDRINEEGGGRREEGFDLIDYRTIILHNWQTLNKLFGYGSKTSSKDKQTLWLHRINEMRKVVMHPSRREYLSNDGLQEIQGYEAWMASQLEESD